MENETLLYAGVAYFIVCCIVAGVATSRGHDFFSAVAVSLFCSPLIGAILYHEYKPGTLETITETVTEPAV